MLTPERKEELKALLAAATPGPWEVVNLGQIEIATNYRVEDGKYVANWIAEMDVQDEDEEEQAGIDAELIVAAVNSLPGLLAALEETEHQLDDIKQRTHSKIYTQNESIKTSREMIDDLFAQLTAAKQQLSGKTEELAEAQQQLVSQTNKLSEAEQTIARQQDHMKLKDDAVEFWISLAGRLADTCEYYADEHWDNGTMAEDALSYYLPAVGRKRA